LLDTIGGLAALGTSILWATGSTFFTFASRELGSVAVNRVRLLLATIFLAITHLAINGALLPVNVKPETWFWFVLSGVIGLALGDAFLFQAFVWIGPRLSMLLMSLAPVISVIFSWIFLAERLTLLQVLGIGVTVLGVSTVILDRGIPNQASGQNRNYLKGLLFGLGGAVGQALGLITSKVGLNAGVSPLSGNLIRMFSAAVIMWIIALVMNQAKVTMDNGHPGWTISWCLAFTGCHSTHACCYCHHTDESVADYSAPSREDHFQGAHWMAGNRRNGSRCQWCGDVIFGLK